jgi:hypothetical protein
VRTKLEEIKNQGYESKDEIKNKIKFDKMTNYQAEKSKH